MNGSPAAVGETVPSPANPQLDWPNLLAQHDRWLRTVVHARLCEPQAVDDVMQEVALAAVRQSAPLSDPAKAAPWLYRLAVTQSLLYRRKMGRKRKLHASYGNELTGGQHAPHAADPLEWLLASERQRLVRVAMERLARRDAEILLLKYTENWSYHELASHLGIGHAAVEARLHRARQRLRLELAALEVVHE